MNSSGVEDSTPHGIPVSKWLDRNGVALLVIDMQNYMTDRKYTSLWSADGADSYYFNRYEKTVLPVIRQLVRFFHALSRPVIFLRIAHMHEKFLDVPAGLARKRLSEDLVDASGRAYSLYYEDHASLIDPRLAPEPADIVVCKTSSGGFCTSELDLILRSNGVSSLVFTGGLTEACVESTYREGFDRGYLCTLVEDGCISSRHEAHEASVRNLERYFGWVTSSETILRALDPAF